MLARRWTACRPWTPPRLPWSCNVPRAGLASYAISAVDCALWELKVRILAVGHRCPRKDAATATAIMIEAIGALASQDSWIVPVQDLAIALNTMPAGPRIGFTMLKKPRAPDTEGAQP